MGTKTTPGNYDCYKNAEPDEPMFVLLARDPLAPALVELWASLRMDATGGSDIEMAYEARRCALQMKKWIAKNRPKKRLVLLK